MTPQQIRQMIREEIRRADSANRFSLNMTNHHTHSGGNDGAQIRADSLIPSGCVSGNITFSTATTYTLNLNSNFTPSFIYAYGNVTHSTERYITFGTASLTPSFFFQPLTNTSVQTGSVQYPTFDPNLGVVVPLQSSVYFGAESAGGSMHTLSSEGHIVRIAYPTDTVHASATVTSFSKTAVQILVDTLESGWSMNINYVIT